MPMGSLRTTIELDEELLKEVMRLRKAKTKKGLIHVLLREELRKKRIQELIQKWGKIGLRYNLKQFLNLRHKE